MKCFYIYQYSSYGVMTYNVRPITVQKTDGYYVEVGTEKIRVPSEVVDESDTLGCVALADKPGASPFVRPTHPADDAVVIKIVLVHPEYIVARHEHEWDFGQAQVLAQHRGKKADSVLLVLPVNEKVNFRGRKVSRSGKKLRKISYARTIHWDGVNQPVVFDSDQAVEDSNYAAAGLTPAALELPGEILSELAQAKEQARVDAANRIAAQMLQQVALPLSLLESDVGNANWLRQVEERLSKCREAAEQVGWNPAQKKVIDGVGDLLAWMRNMLELEKGFIGDLSTAGSNYSPVLRNMVNLIDHVIEQSGYPELMSSVAICNRTNAASGALAAASEGCLELE